MSCKIAKTEYRKIMIWLSDSKCCHLTVQCKCSLCCPNLGPVHSARISISVPWKSAGLLYHDFYSNYFCLLKIIEKWQIFRIKNRKKISMGKFIVCLIKARFVTHVIKCGTNERCVYKDGTKFGYVCIFCQVFKSNVEGVSKKVCRLINGHFTTIFLAI